MKFVLLLAAISVAGWAVARWASTGADPRDESFGAAYNRELTQMCGFMAVLSLVVGVPVAFVAARTEDPVAPVLVGAAALVVGFVLVDRVGRRFPSLRLPTGEQWQEDLRAQLAPLGVRLAVAFIIVMAFGLILIGR